jgi:salicylate hydroxylase
MQTPTACSKMVDLAAASGKALHLGEGQVQEDRDNAFAALKAGKWARAG